MFPLVLLVVVFGERPLEAYVDPGSASYLFQLIVGGALGFFYLLRTYWSQVTGFVRARVRSRHVGE